VTKNYTGAEIEAVCRSATSFSLFKEVSQNPETPSSLASGSTTASKKSQYKKNQKFTENLVMMADFE